jgi:predicted transcriptional regulator of viral defense system
MCAAVAKPDSEQLFEIAEAQQGYFTAGQAVEAGYARSTHSYHVEAGNWMRECRGIYRLRRYPQSDDGQLVLWSLWSRDRAGEPEGVYSHLTALRIKDLSDANPSRLHMTVPPDFRRNGEVPSILVLHKAKLAPGEFTRERGYAVTTPMRAIVDLAVSGEADRDIIKQALREGQSRGIITRKHITAANARDDLPTWLRRLLEDAA